MCVQVCLRVQRVSYVCVQVSAGAAGVTRVCPSCHVCAGVSTCTGCHACAGVCALCVVCMQLLVCAPAVNMGAHRVSSVCRGWCVYRVSRVCRCLCTGCHVYAGVCAPAVTCVQVSVHRVSRVCKCVCTRCHMCAGVCAPAVTCVQVLMCAPAVTCVQVSVCHACEGCAGTGVHICVCVCARGLCACGCWAPMGIRTGLRAGLVYVHTRVHGAVTCMCGACKQQGPCNAPRVCTPSLTGVLWGGWEQSISPPGRLASPSWPGWAGSGPGPCSWAIPSAELTLRQLGPQKVT